MGGSIGSITFHDDLYCPTLFEKFSNISEKRALDGTVVQSYLTGSSSQDEPHTIKFFWEEQATLNLLRNLARSHASFTVSLSSGGTTLTNCRFRGDDPIKATPLTGEDFFSHDAVEGKVMDLFNGELHIWARRAV